MVFPQDLLEKGLDADNFAMLGLGDIVIPGEDRRGMMGLGSPLRGLRGAERVPGSVLGQAQPCACLPVGWESPAGPAAVPVPRATRGHCHPGHGTGAPRVLPCLPPSARPYSPSLSLPCSSGPSLSLLCHFQPLIVSFSLQGSSLPCC